MEIDLNLEEPQGEFTLLFEGTIDSTPETLRKVKGVFLAELEMPIDQIALILQNTPAPVLTSNDASDLAHPYRILKEAGSKVLIVNANGTSFNLDSLAEDATSIVFELEDPLSMDGDLDFIEQTKAPLPTYQLGDDLELSLDSLMEEAAAKVVDSRVEEEDLQRIPAYEFKLDLDLGEIETPTPKPELEPVKSAQTLPLPTELADNEFSLSLDDPEPAEIIVKAPKSIVVEKAFDSGLELDSLPEIETQDLELGTELTLGPGAEVVKKEVIKVEPSKDNDSATEPEDFMLIAEKSVEPVLTVAPEPVAIKAIVAAKPVAIKAEAKPVPPPPPPKAATQQESLSSTAEISVVPIRSKTRKKLPQGLETSILIVIGSAVLFAANWFYFNAPPATDIEAEKAAEHRALQIAQKKEIQQNKKERAQALEEEQNTALKVPITFQGAIEVSGYNLNLEVTISNKTPTKASFTINGTEPPELTNEQIARNEKREPWIRRAESAAFEFKNTSASGFIGTAASKIYVEYDGIAKRLVENAYLEGDFNPTADLLNLTLSLSSESNPSAVAPHWLISSAENQARFEFVQKFVLKKISTSQDLTISQDTTVKVQAE